MRTRGVLVRAAAVEFGEAGYGGARLSRICESAAVSMGALTFHFPIKAALADAVEKEGGAITRALVERLRKKRGPELDAVIGLTIGLAGLLEEDLVVRSSVRLARERPGGAGRWVDVWLPAVLELLHRAYEGGQLRQAEGSFQAVADMIVYLLAGAESQIRYGVAAPAGASRSASDQLEQIWRLVLCGVAAEGP
ncbi:TetR/AcrR family transcriptional regulator [Streptomyces sp. A3M-1-3]|uniref:TetR family transcriptional regulator n=1 Tax=Streptomyces sp. A3M-1-3 TaxID=2962044 RepID=UPI0020B8EC93|nr:helix-turn-helix domain-containing protein [Streptomyces sp. A3M-1-3]MCP3819189.1 TetR/AcrR family transcriptional regulator [Streptomyces sp. A3M-1-3]